MTCYICQEISSGKKIYEDDYVVAFLARDSSIPGHIQVAPKKHHTIFEYLSDYEAGYLFCIVNKLSYILVNYLKVSGINVVASNGVEAGQAYPHFVVNVIPRSENDGKDFTWQPKQLSAEDLSNVQEKLKSALKAPEKKSDKKEEEGPQKDDKKDEKDDNGREDNEENREEVEEEKDYLIRSLDRIP